MPRTLTAAILFLLAGCSHAPSELSNRETLARTSDSLIETKIKEQELSFLAYSGRDDIAIIKSNAKPLLLAYLSLTNSIGIDPSTVNWSEIAFTRDQNYTPPRDKDAVVRWPVPLTSAGTLGATGRKSLFSTIPHEQVHAIQEIFGKLPRWFSEGMAEWAGLKATNIVAPDLYIARKKQLDAELKALASTPDLKSWGAVKPKPDAILRQLTPEQKKRMVSEPGYFPPGPFTFGPDDLISDESNTFARYAASLRLFEQVEQASSPESMKAWFEAVRNLPSPKSESEIVRLAKITTGVDITEMLN